MRHSLKPIPRRWVIGTSSAVAVGMLIVNKSLLHSMATEHKLATLACFAVAILLCISPLLTLFRRLAEALFSMSSKFFLFGLFAVSLGIHVTIAVDSFDAIPRLDDGVGSLFQARIFVRGKVVLPLPSNAAFYEQFSVIGHYAARGHWCGMYPFGWPALLVPGVIINAPWLVNPVLGALLVISIVVLAREYAPERVSRTAGMLALFSPGATTLAATHLSHTSTALFLTLTLLCARRLLRTQNSIFGLLAGVCWSMAFLCRPLTTLAAGAVIALGILFEIKAFLRAWRGLIPALLAAIAGVAILLSFQHATTGDAFTSGHKAGMPRRAKYGFGWLDHARTHTPAIGTTFSALRFRATNEALLGWPVAAFLLGLIPFLRGKVRWRDAFLFFPYASLIFCYLFYWYLEVYFPARYTFAGWPMLFILVALGLHDLAEICAARNAFVRRIPYVLVFASFAFLSVVVTPDWFRRFISQFGDVEGVLPRTVAAYDITNAVVFMDSVGVSASKEDNRNDYYATGFMRNDLDLRSDVIYARNLREKNVNLFSDYPDRDYYHYRYDRGHNRAYLWRLHPHDGAFTATPIRPREQKLLLDAATFPKSP